MKKKLLIAAALTMAVALSLTACGNKPKTYTEKDLETMSAEQAESILNEKITATETTPNTKGKEVLDIWSDVVLIGEGHEGNDPNAEFRIEYTGDNQFIKENITYSWDNFYLSGMIYNGKEVDCSAECDEELLKKNNYVIETKSHTLLIEGLDEKLTELKDEYDYTAQDKKITEAFIKELDQKRKDDFSVCKNFIEGGKIRLYNAKFMQLYVRTPDSDEYSYITIDEIKDIYPIKRTLIYIDLGTFNSSDSHYELDFAADITAHYDDGTIFEGTVWIGNTDDMSAYVNKDNTIGSDFDKENYKGTYERFRYLDCILLYSDDMLDGYIEGYKATFPTVKITSQNIK